MNLYNAKQSLTSSTGEESPILKAVSSTAQAARTLDLPAALLLLHVVVLHLAGWRNAERRARNRAGRRVDNRDSVASTLSHRLVQLHVVLVAGRRRVERIRSGREKE